MLPPPPPAAMSPRCFKLTVIHPCSQYDTQCHYYYDAIKAEATANGHLVNFTTRNNEKTGRRENAMGWATHKTSTTTCIQTMVGANILIFAGVHKQTLG
jgi:hypothetical protein